MTIDSNFEVRTVGSESACPGAQLRVVGHRGAMDHAPENTVAAFARAEADGADAIELDIHLSADGVIVVNHDATIDRTAASDSLRRTGRIDELTWAQLQEVALDDGERIISLPEALEMISVPIHLEIKAVAAAVPAAEMVTDISETGDGITLISFKPEALRAVADVNPKLQRGLIVKSCTEEVLRQRDELATNWFSSGFEGLTQETVQQLHDQGVYVGAWMLRNVDQAKTAVTLGLDAVTSDDPAAARRMINAV